MKNALLMNNRLVFLLILFFQLTLYSRAEHFDKSLFKGYGTAFVLQNKMIP